MLHNTNTIYHLQFYDSCTKILTYKKKIDISAKNICVERGHTWMGRRK